MNVSDLKGQKIMMAVSGGLDSCTISHWLSQQGVEVIAYTADLGQPDEADIEDLRERMLACGAREMLIGDLKEAISRAGIQLVQAQARYEGGALEHDRAGAPRSRRRYGSPNARTRYPSSRARRNGARQRPSSLPTPHSNVGPANWRLCPLARQ